jgi:hypothetical protein
MNLISNLFGQASEFWSKPAGDTSLFIWVGIAMLAGFGILFAILQAPPQSRRWIIFSFTFLCGLFYVLLWLVPTPENRQPGDLPRNFTEKVAFTLSDGVAIVGNLSNILTGILLLLGVASLLRIHFIRITKQQKDWFFSVVLLVSLFAIAFFGYATWITELNLTPEQAEAAQNPATWSIWRRGQDFLFDGLLQAMDAAMFSLIAFYILSAAYRAFRIRSIEATILLASALLVMLSLLGIVEYFWGGMVDNMTGSDPASPLNNLKLNEIAGFIRRSFQSPGLRAIDFGIGIGALAMALRLWLGLERGGGSN